MNFKDCQVGDVVKFIDADPEYAEDYGKIGTIWFLLPPEDKLGCEMPLVQVDCTMVKGGYLVSRPDQLEKLL